MSLPGRQLLCAYTDSTIWKYLQEGWDVGGWARADIADSASTPSMPPLLVTCQMKVTRLCILGGH